MKTQLLNDVHWKARVKFAREYGKYNIFWRHVLWSDKTKIELFGRNDVKYVWRNTKRPAVRETLYTIPIVKHGGGSIVLWSYFSALRVGTLHSIEGNLKKEDCHKILKENLKRDARKLGTDGDGGFNMRTTQGTRLNWWLNDWIRQR